MAVSGTSARPKLLVVEDDLQIATALVTYAEHRGFDALHAADGIVAVELAEREWPDVILLDIALPGRDGRDVYVELQKSGVARKAVVIFATARDEQVDRLTGLEMGAAEYETKPFQLATLFTKIDALLEKKRRGDI